MSVANELIVSHIDVINNKHWKPGTDALIFGKDKQYKAKLTQINNCSPAPQPNGLKIVGNATFEYSTVANQKRTTFKETFVIYQLATGVTQLHGFKSVQGVPNSTTDVSDRQAIVGQTISTQFNPYTIKSGLPHGVLERMKFWKDKLKTFQSDHNKEIRILSKQDKAYVDDALLTLLEHIADGIHDENELEAIKRFCKRMHDLQQIPQQTNNNTNCNNQTAVIPNVPTNQNTANNEESKSNNDLQLGKKPKKDKQSYKCPFCPVKKANYSYLRSKHIVIEHDGEVKEQWIKCDLCDEYYKDQKSVNRHKSQGKHKMARVEIGSLCPRCKTSTLMKGVLNNGQYTKVFCKDSDKCYYNDKYIGDNASYSWSARRK
eukprot:174917_1